MSSGDNKCTGALTPDLKDRLKLPEEPYDVHVCSIEDNQFLFRTTIKTPREIESFLKKWSQKTSVVWRVNKTNPKGKSAGKKNVFWKEFRCQNGNTKLSKKSKNVHKKHTNCPAKMSVTVKHVTLQCRSSDPHLPKYPTIIKINIDHNHMILHQDYLKNQSVPNEVRKKFLSMFRKGHTPMSALNLHKTELQQVYGDDYADIVLDRSVCPDVQWCYRLFSSFHRNKSSTSNPDEEPEENNEHEIKLELVEELVLDIEDESGDKLVLDIEEESEETTDLQHSDEFELTCINLRLFTEHVINKMKTLPETYLPAVNAFNRSWQSFQTDFEFIDALRSFGGIEEIEQNME